MLQALPIPPPPTRAGLRRGEVLSLAVALVLHGGVLLAIVHTTGDRLVGGGGSELDAINIEVITQSQVLEALAVDPTARIPASATRADAAAVAALAQSSAVDHQKGEQAEASLVPDETAPARAEAADQSEVAAVVHAAAAAENVQASQTSTTARGTSTFDLEAPAYAAAPPGVERDYARTVLFTLAHNKPKASVGHRGTVKIGFTVLASGKVGSVRVAQSSGRPALDEAALAAVRSTEFPAPPPELRTGTLAYEIPYIFR
jgi:protein TonB